MIGSYPVAPSFASRDIVGGVPGEWFGTAAVDGDRGSWLKAPIGTTYWKRVTDNQVEQYIKTKRDDRDDDWVMVQGIISERFVYADFTDGGSTTGTVSVNGTLPVGAYYDKAQVHNVTGFAGDTTATIQISGGVDVTTDVDGYTTGTPSVFATATAVVVGVPSGVRTVTTAGIPLITITKGTDWGAGTSGALTVTLFYKV